MPLCTRREWFFKAGSGSVVFVLSQEFLVWKLFSEEPQIAASF
jgi:hypothetical protein